MAEPPKWIRELVTVAETHGWTYGLTKTGHPRLTPPARVVDPRTGRRAYPIKMASTPSDRRGHLNAKTDLRRLGVPIPHGSFAKSRKERDTR